MVFCGRTIVAPFRTLLVHVGCVTSHTSHLQKNIFHQHFPSALRVQTDRQTDGPKETERLTEKHRNTEGQKEKRDTVRRTGQKTCRGRDRQKDR